MKNINLDKEDQAYYCGKYSEKEVLQFIAKLEVQKKVENWFTVTEDDLHLIANMTIEEIEEVWQGVDFEVHKEDMEYLVNLNIQDVIDYAKRYGMSEEENRAMNALILRRKFIVQMKAEEFKTDNKDTEFETYYEDRKDEYTPEICNQ